MFIMILILKYADLYLILFMILLLVMLLPIKILVMMMLVMLVLVIHGYADAGYAYIPISCCRLLCCFAVFANPPLHASPLSNASYLMIAMIEIMNEDGSKSFK